MDNQKKSKWSRTFHSAQTIVGNVEAAAILAVGMMIVETIESVCKVNEFGDVSYKKNVQD